jgi:hypothetical protein
VLDADVDLFGDRVRMQIDKRFEQVFGLLTVVVRIVLHLLEQPPIRRVGAVIGQHVEDEPLLDRLPHAVQVERLELAVGPLFPEKFEGFLLRCRGKGEGREVRQPSALLHLRQNDVLQLLLWSFGLTLFRLRLFQGSGRQHGFEALRTLA